MAKTKQITFRINPEDKNMLVIMCKKTVRTKSDMVRFLIHHEFIRGGYTLPVEPKQGENGREDGCTE